ncbi:MAG: hypothetical protein QGI60_02585 [archaeon]|jgi:preprotein translocase subunit SecF|nr:hypothetical protein [archaeon]
MNPLIGLYKGNYKRLLIIPIIILIATSFLAFVYPGVPLGIDLSGGTLIIMRSEKPLDARVTEEILVQNFDLTDLSVVSTSSPVSGNGLTIKFARNTAIFAAEKELALAKAAQGETAIAHSQTVIELVSDYIPAVTISADAEKAVLQASEAVVDAKESFNNQVQTLVSEKFQLGKEVAFQKKEVSPTLGNAFYRTAFNVGIVAMILITIVIFIFFRQIVPSAAVIASSALDIIGALGLMALFQIPLTLSSIPALLMLIGYSVDADVMLTTKLLKRMEQSKDQRVYDSLITGLTMNFTTIAALSAMLILSFTSQMLVVFEISAVLLFGLLIDLSSTWFMNAPVLLWYIERRERV